MEKFTSLAEVLSVQDPAAPDQPPSDATATKLSRKEFCRELLASREYRMSLLRRIIMDALPPAIEALMYHYAYGKPVERLEHTGAEGGPIVVTRVERRIVDPRDQVHDEDAPKEESVH